MNKTLQALAVAMLIALLGAATLSSPVTAEPSRTSQATQNVSRCALPDLSVKSVAIGGAAMVEVARLVITNDIQRPCRVRGYAHLQRLSRHGNPVATHVHRRGSYSDVFPDPGPRRITLQPGHSASAAVSWSEAAATRHGQPAQRCRTSAYLRVRLSPSSRHRIIRTGREHGPRRADRIYACGGDLTLTAWQRGPHPEKK